MVCVCKRNHTLVTLKSSLFVAVYLSLVFAVRVSREPLISAFGCL